MLPTYLTVTEAAEALGVSRERVYDWIKSGKLPIAARSEYAGFLLSRKAVERDGRKLADDLLACKQAAAVSHV